MHDAHEELITAWRSAKQALATAQAELSAARAEIARGSVKYDAAKELDRVEGELSVAAAVAAEAAAHDALQFALDADERISDGPARDCNPEVISPVLESAITDVASIRAALAAAEARRDDIVRQARGAHSRWQTARQEAGLPLPGRLPLRAVEANGPLGGIAGVALVSEHATESAALFLKGLSQPPPLNRGPLRDTRALETERTSLRASLAQKELDRLAKVARDEKYAQERAAEEASRLKRQALELAGERARFAAARAAEQKLSDMFKGEK